MNKPTHPNFESAHIDAQNISAIEKLFPSCITEVLDEAKSTPEKKVYKHAVNFEKLRELLGADVAEGDESYEFTWVGKKAAIKEAGTPVRMTLRPCREESKNWDTTQNLYIEGDNLDVLKMLQESYLGKVKMIYIDPPYNTGNDFIYNDSFKVDSYEFKVDSGEIDDDDNRMFRNTDSNGRFHSDWCSMIYPRLALARNLLTDDGVIFISIDDNEQSNLKKICDEVFGEGNFVAEFIWKSKLGKVGTTTTISATHEYILCYGKIKSNLYFKMLSTSNEGRHENLRQWGQADRREDRPSMFYPITIDGVTVYPIKDDGTEGRWRVGKEMADDLLSKGLLYLSETDGKKNIYRNFEPGVSIIPYDTMLLDDIGTTAKGALQLKSLDLNKTFDYSKPISLVKHFTSLCTTNNSPLSTNNSPIILDFFSGSATTAHAVMQLNAEDGGNRKFIMVQLPEKCDEKSEAFKAGYKNICEIGKERIRRAGERIVESCKLKDRSLEEGKDGELSRINSLAKGDGSGTKDLFDCEEITKGGDVCFVGSDETGCSVDSVKHSRETGAKFSEGVCSVSQNSAGIKSGVGNTTSDLCSSEVSDRTGNTISNEYAFGNSQNDKCHDASTNNSQLTTNNYQLDIGFRVLKADTTNMKEVYYTPAQYSQDLLKSVESNIKEDRTDMDLLYACLLDWGLPLSLPHFSEMIDGLTVHTYGMSKDDFVKLTTNNSQLTTAPLIACFANNIPESTIRTIAARKPLRVVFRDSSFASAPEKINVTEIFKTITPDTSVKVI